MFHFLNVYFRIFSYISSPRRIPRERGKGVHCVDLGESFQTRIYMQNLASIQPRTSHLKFGVFQKLAWISPSGFFNGCRFLDFFRGPFSAVSRPIFATEGSLSRIFQALHICLYIIPNVCECSGFFCTVVCTFQRDFVQFHGRQHSL